MASSNPFRVRDLIHKYGWDFVARLASLGVQYQAEAQVLFVDSGATNTLDADDTVHGHSFENPLATIDYAIGLCTASEGSVILAAPGHNENLGNAQIDFDVAGVTCIFLGSGPLRGRIDFDHANASIDIGANGVTIVNLGLLPSVTAVLKGVDVESGVTDFKMVNCEFMIGEDGAGDDEFVKAITLTSGNHDCIFDTVKILAHASAAGATHGIHVDAASDRLTFKSVIIDGPYATGGIVEDAAGVNHVVEDCSVDTSGTNYSFHGSSTFAKRTRNLDAGAAEDTGENLIGKDDADNAAATTNVVANADGSVLEREEFIQTKIGTPVNAGGTATLGAVLGDVANSDIATRLTTLQTGNPKLVSKALADLNGYDSAAIFTVTGDVLARVFGVVGATAITSTSGTTTLSLGTTEAVAGIIAASTIDNTQFAATDVWVDSTPANDVEALAAQDWHIIGGGADILLTRNVDDLTAGALTLYCQWIPLSSGATVVAA